MRMKRTGPTKQRTRDLIVTLDKHGKSTQQTAYRTISELLKLPTRIRAEVNVEHLNKLATQTKDKVFVVAGKVMAKGEVNQPIQVAALGFSANAKQKIMEAKGKTWTLEQLIENKVPAQKMVMVK